MWISVPSGGSAAFKTNIAPNPNGKTMPHASTK
jgi:hypothetical protein